MILGVHLTLLIGPTIAVPAPLALTEALSSVEVTQNDNGHSGFTLTFEVGRSGPWDLVDDKLVKHPLIRPYNRVAIQVRFNLTPTVLINGCITMIELKPSQTPGDTKLVVTGGDVSVLMDMEQTTRSYTCMPEVARVAQILGLYPLLKFAGAQVIPPPVPSVPVPTEAIPIQNSTDFEYLKALAAPHGYVFHVKPGPAPNTNIPYWGPSVPPTAMAGAALNRALSVNMGPQTNVDSISFKYDATLLTKVTDKIVDPDSNVAVPLLFPPFSTSTPLALIPGAVYQGMRTKVTRMDLARPRGQDADQVSRENEQLTNGQRYALALEAARAKVQDSANRVVTATGQLDALQYGGVLQAGTVVGLRGAGFTYDGMYFVRSVNHSISKGKYTQAFTLRREGVGSLVPRVRP